MSSGRRTHVDLLLVGLGIASIPGTKYVSNGLPWSDIWPLIAVGFVGGLIGGIVWYWWLLPHRYPWLDPETSPSKATLTWIGIVLAIVALLHLMGRGSDIVTVAACGGASFPAGLRPIYTPPLRVR